MNIDTNKNSIAEKSHIEYLHEMTIYDMGIRIATFIGVVAAVTFAAQLALGHIRF